MNFILQKLREFNRHSDFDQNYLPFSIVLFDDGSGSIRDAFGQLVYEFESIDQLNTYLLIKTRFGGTCETV